MKSFLVAFLFLEQAGTQGVVTGVVRGASGMPAPGVRVYAVGVRDSPEALNTGTAPLEGLTQTDGSGRYRLEVTPGRYYIASGSVNSPTFYPGTANAAEARVVTVGSGGLVESIDFSSFVPAASRPPVTSTGVLSGVIRFPDGMPAPRIPVVIISASLVSGGPATSPAPVLPASPPPTVPGASAPVSRTFTVAVSTSIGFGGGTRLMTSSDAGGRYTIANLPTDSYYIAAGYAEAPSVYPGGTDLSKAKTITVAPTTNLNTLDFQVARPPTPNVVVRGRVSSLGNAPAGGAIVELRRTSSAALQGFALPTISPDRTVVAGPDGKFEFANVGSGSYVVMANQFNIRAEGRNIVVADQTLEVDLLLRGYQVSGRILAEDGSSIPDARLFADAIVTTVDNPSIITSTVLPIAGDGSFGRILVAGEYRFFLRALPAEYSIKSITAGGIDLMKDRLKFGNNEPGVIEVRVTKRTISSDSSTVGVRGRAIDAITAAPAVAERLTLCCRGSGPVERFSSSIEADGSFEFSAIPPGRYAVGLQTVAGTPNLFPVGDVIVGMESITGLEILTTPRFGELSATLVFEDGSIDSASFAASVVFTGTNGRVRVVASGVNGTYLAAVPVGDRYTVSVIDIPQGYAIKSISGSTDLRSVNFPTGTAAQSPSSSRLVITLTRESRQPVVPSR